MRPSRTPSSSMCAAACLRLTSLCSPSCWPLRSYRTASKLTQVSVQRLRTLCKLCCSVYKTFCNTGSHADIPGTYPMLHHTALICSLVHTFICWLIHSFICVNMWLPIVSPGTDQVETSQHAVASRLSCDLASTAAFTFLSITLCFI